MKTHRKPLTPGQNQLKSRRGVALITVLTIISLCTILVLTFFQLAQNEMVSSDSYNNGIEAQTIAEEAVNLVIRQIREATANEESKNGIGWASQPGVIRTWDSRGGFHKGYKLYSDELMVEVDSERKLGKEDYEDLKQWDSKPWQYVDLNEPVIRGERVYYPIVDPVAAEYPKWPKKQGNDQTGVEGFFVDEKSVPVGAISESVEKLQGPDNKKRKTLPMPVKWIYQLADGSLGTLNDSKKFVAVTGGSVPTDKNPIVARFAFWADDETLKLNPNVHAGGASWATPMASGMVDRESFARYQPTQHEWQRYPGHPATTHLGPVLAPGIPDITYDRDAMEILFGLVPRVVGGGSLSGTRKVDFNDPRERDGLVADKDRLYASLDEFMLEPGIRRNRPTRSDQIREPNEFPDPNGRRGAVMPPDQVQDQLERTKFFLSVVSRAPETTIFNTPRVSIWPTRTTEDLQENDIPLYQTPFDRLIRFCGEVGKSRRGESRNKYYFERLNADSVDIDINEIPRNFDILKYLDALTQTKIPGLGESFASKYEDMERRQILTEIFDYIRCTNLHDDSLYGGDWRSAFAVANVAEPRTYTNPRTKSNEDRGVHKGHGQVTPIKFEWEGAVVKGFGRFTTMYEVGVHIICCAKGTGSGGGATPRNSYPGIRKYPSGWYKEEAKPDSPDSFAPDHHYSNFPPMPAAVNVNQEKYVRNKNEIPFGDQEPAPGWDRYDIPYAVKSAAWAQWPTWLRKMVEPRYLRDPKIAGRGPDNINREHDPDLYHPELIPYAFDERRWNWQLAWLDSAYADAMPASKFDRNALSMRAWKSGATRLQAGERMVQACLKMQGFCPSLGWVPINPDWEMEIKLNSPFRFSYAPADTIEGPDNRDGISTPVPKIPDSLAGGGPYIWASNQRSLAHHDRSYGGTRSWDSFTVASQNRDTDPETGLFPTGLPKKDAAAGIRFNGRATPVDKEWDNAKIYNRYHFVSRPWRINTDTVTMDNTVRMEFDIYSAGKSGSTQGTVTNVDRQLVQNLTMEFPQFSAPAPELAEGNSGYYNEFGHVESGPVPPINYWSLSVDGFNPTVGAYGRMGFGDSHKVDSVVGGDVLKSVGVKDGDARVIAALPVVPKELFYFRPGYKDNGVRFAHTFRTTPGYNLTGADSSPQRSLVPGLSYKPLPLGTGSSDSKDVQKFGDFDNGMGNSMDGPYINKPDEGNTHSLFNRTEGNAIPTGQFDMARDYGDYPYFVRDYIHEPGTPAYFSPNRIISSPVQFGSLSVGVHLDADGQERRGWRTLLFRPDAGSDHPGSISPADHYLLDLFWMPVVEPYAISEPLSTGGKVNLNYQILPFKHIKRNTALRGVFKSEYMLTIPNGMVEDYKSGVGRGRGYHWRDAPYRGKLQSKSLRSVILDERTLEQFDKKFDDEGTIFRTASQICEIHLIPQEIAEKTQAGGASELIGLGDVKLNDMEDGSFWRKNALVGDNSRERPYSNIYPRVTTKSNTFKVHYRAQVLRKARGSKADQWDVLSDQVVAEYRGSSIIERYVDPNDPDIPDYVELLKSGRRDVSDLPTIDEFYRFRIVHPTRFAP